MRRQFKFEVVQARNEVAKAQEAMAGTEERLRASEAIERSRLEAEHQTKLSAVMQEAGRRERELARHTAIIQQEMLRWRQQAHLAAAAVLEAKDEVLERRRELGATNDRMDTLVEKLYAGRDHGMDLQAAISAYQRMAAAAGAGDDGGPVPAAAGTPLGDGRKQQGLGRLLPTAAGAGHGGGMATGAGARPQQQQQQRQQGGAGAPGGNSRLPPIGAGARGGVAAPALASELSYGPPWAGQKGLLAPRSAAETSPPGGRGAKQQQGSYAALHGGPQQQQGAAPPRGAPKPGGAAAADGVAHTSAAYYLQVPSRVLESAATYSAAAGAAAKRRVEQRQRAAGKAPDRFADAAKTAGMISAMASRWH